MLNVRQSIMNRKPKAVSDKNQENIDKEYDAQMRALRAKQDKYAMKEAEVRQTVSPQREETLKRQEALKAAMEEQLKLKEAERQRMLEEEQKFEAYNEYLRSSGSPRSVAGDVEREKERKEYLKGMMEDNIRLANLKKELSEKQKQLEVEMDKIRAATPSTWNRRHYM